MKATSVHTFLSHVVKMSAKMSDRKIVKLEEGKMFRSSDCKCQDALKRFFNPNLFVFYVSEMMWKSQNARTLVRMAMDKLSVKAKDYSIGLRMDKREDLSDRNRVVYLFGCIHEPWFTEVQSIYTLDELVEYYLKIFYSGALRKLRKKSKCR